MEPSTFIMRAILFATDATVVLPQKEISKLEMNATNTSLARVFKLPAALDLELVVRTRDQKAPTSEW